MAPTPPPAADPVRELRRFAEAPLRRPWLVVIPFVLSLVAAVAASFLLPPRYKSSTLILVAPERMPSNLVPQMATEQTTRRLQTLRQEVHSRTRLEMVARSLDPYGTLGKEPLIDTIERMRAATTVSVKGTDAFSVEYEHSDPKMAMLVADRLTTLFMEEVAGARQQQVSAAYQFIESQLQEARKQLEEKERALREFKEKHMGQLPEQVQANLATLQRLQLEQQSVADGLRKAQDALLLLESASPSSGVALPGATPPPDSLSTLRAGLAQLRTRYTVEHPDVKALEARIAALEAAQAGRDPEAPPADPAVAAWEQRKRGAQLEIQTLKGRLADVDRRIAAFQARVEAAPQREQEIIGLTRDYQKLSDNYTQLLAKKLDTEMAARLEQEEKGQQFRVLDPAYLPVRPSFPDRGLFALAGALVGLMLGVGLAVVVDHLDPTVKDAEDLGKVVPYPVLAVIPYVPPKEQRKLAAARPVEPGGGPDHDDHDDHARGAHGGGREKPRARSLPFRRPGNGGRGREAS
jgi:polysaccharide chain length determinant protein (PEP-CTERM system associated)